jgi:hypothetical protein
MTRCFQHGHGDPRQRPSASQWQQLLIDVENDQAYLNKVLPLFQAAAWLKRAPAAVPNSPQSPAANTFSKPTNPAANCPVNHPPQRAHGKGLRNKRRVLNAATIAILLLGAFFAYKYRFAIARAFHFDATPRYSTENDGHGKPTPKLWQKLRDAP